MEKDYLDCTDTNAKTVMSYYRKGIKIFLPLHKYAKFFRWIESLNAVQPKGELISDRHEGKGLNNGVIFRSLYYNKQQKSYEQ